MKARWTQIPWNKTSTAACCIQASCRWIHCHFSSQFFLHSWLSHLYMDTALHSSVLSLFLKLILIKETQASCSFTQATHSVCSSSLRVQWFSFRGGNSRPLGLFLCPPACHVPHQESRLKAIAAFFLLQDGGSTKTTLWLSKDAMPLLLLEPSSHRPPLLRHRWQSHDLTRSRIFSST